MAVFEAGHKSPVTPGSRLSDSPRSSSQHPALTLACHEPRGELPVINAANEIPAQSAAGKLEPKVSAGKSQRTTERVRQGVNLHGLNPARLPAPLLYAVPRLSSVPL